jgi:hypothetical protein
MNFRLPNPVGKKYQENFDRVFARVHLKVKELNGVPHVLCNRRNVDKWSVDADEVNCKQCIARMNDVG